MKRIKLGGKLKGITLVDDIDFEFLSQFPWYQDSHGYVRYSKWINGQSTAVYMHRVIMQFPEKPLEVDHINGARLDNKRANLRIVTHRQNQTNFHKPDARCNYGRNIYYMTDHPRSKPYAVQCKDHGKNVYGGYFATLEEAQVAASQLRKKLGYLTAYP